ncbi:Putative ATP-binding protein of sugar ABC transporter [Frankia alni ACN14a]|uniref:ATP-binding protein of sugar ABC transporter n=2 Tax=Frankiaceae TaxID=74712 RepID=Q0RMS3_FRAAA|nr:Putative ATP-binding protein of sugar ABC transporter [Frankia alni ACN14a]
MSAMPADDARTAIVVRGLSKSFGSTQALDGVRLELAWGEIHGLVGGNGSGKSTLIKILAGVLEADAGELTTDGSTWDLTRHTPAESARAGFRFVHQDLGVVPVLSVGDNLGLGGHFVRGPLGTIRSRRSRRRAAEVLRRFDLDVDPRVTAASLSTPQRALLAIARALQDVDESGRAILVLDEPTAALPAEEASELLRTLRRLAEAGHSVVLVTHRLDEVRRAADRVTCIRDGRHVGTLDAADLSEARLVELILGGKLERTVTAAGPADASAAPVLELRHVAGGPLRDVSLTLRPGEIVGIAGLLGSGRTELMEMIYGARRIERGDLVVRGTAVRSPSTSAMTRRGVAFVPEDRIAAGIFPQESVATNMTAGQSGRYFAKLRLRTGLLLRDVARDVSTYAVRTSSVHLPINALSGGNQQKVVLGRWLRTSPTVLLLDEPTQGIDVGSRETVLGLVSEASRAGTAVILVSSEFEELTRISHRVLVLCDGRIADEHPHGMTSHDLLESVLEKQRATR